MAVKKLPAIQFYPGDWRKDVGVQSLSFHDRGIWFEMLMLMHESSVRGKLMLGNKAATDEALARALRIDLHELQQTITVLIELGVTEREKKTGALINRRMIRDEKSRSTNRKRLHDWRNTKKTNTNGNADVTPDVTAKKRLPSSSSSSSSSTSVSTPKPPLEDLVFDHDMVATAVMAETGSAGMNTRMVLASLALNEIAKGRTGLDVKDHMIRQWNRYCDAIGKLDWAYGSAEKFFAGGLWNTEAGWPWKKGEEPKSKPRLAVEKL